MSDAEPLDQRRTVLTRTRQLRALANEARLQIIGLLRERPRAMSELAIELGLQKGSINYHLRVLERTGIARQSDTQTVRGGTRFLWELTAPGFAVQIPNGGAGGRPAVLRTLADQMERGTEPRVFLSHVRLDRSGRTKAIEILEHALSEIRTLQSDRGVLTTIASLAFGSSTSGDPHV